MRSILVTDDDRTCRDSMRRALEKEGYRVESAPDVESALACLRTHHVRLVVCDYRMPGRTGIDLLQELKRQESRVPVMMISALIDAATKTLARELGAIETLEKPVRRRDLIDRAARFAGA